MPHGAATAAWKRHSFGCTMGQRVNERQGKRSTTMLLLKSSIRPYATRGIQGADIIVVSCRMLQLQQRAKLVQNKLVLAAWQCHGWAVATHAWCTRILPLRRPIQPYATWGFQVHSPSARHYNRATRKPHPTMCQLWHTTAVLPRSPI